MQTNTMEGAGATVGYRSSLSSRALLLLPRFRTYRCLARWRPPRDIDRIMANVADLASFLAERREAYSGMPNREQAEARFGSDVARLRIEYGNRVVE